MFRHLEMIMLVVASTIGAAEAAEPIKVGVFAVDASPPIGSPLAYDATKGVVHPLSCRGVVLLGEGQPVVLCAVDWIGIANRRGATDRHCALIRRYKPSDHRDRRGFPSTVGTEEPDELSTLDAE